MVVQVATPLASGLALQFAIAVPPLVNVTVPVGVTPGTWDATVAVRVTGWLSTEGFGEAVRVVLVTASVTAKLNGATDPNW